MTIEDKLSAIVRCPTDKVIRTVYIILEHVVGVVGIPVNVVGLWCIYSDKKSTIKGALLNCQLWMFLCNISYSLLTTPLFLFPVPAYYSYGFLTLRNIEMSTQFIIMIFFYSGTGAAMLHLFFYRHQTLLSHDHSRSLRSPTRYILLIVCYVYFCLGFPISVHFGIIDNNEQGILEYSLIFPCLSPEIFLPQTTITGLDNLPFVAFFAISYFILWTAFMYFLVVDSFASIRNNNRKMSKQAQNQVHRSLRNLIIQISFTCLMIIIPCSCMFTMSMLKVGNQDVFVMIAAVISMHASIGTIISIYLNRQHRKTLELLIRKSSSSVVYLLRD